MPQNENETNHSLIGWCTDPPDPPPRTHNPWHQRDPRRRARRWAYRARPLPSSFPAHPPHVLAHNERTAVQYGATRAVRPRREGGAEVDRL